MRVELRVVQLSQSDIPADFSAAHRLLRKDGFGHVFHAKSVAGKHFKIFFSQNIKQNARLGIVASKKILPDAVSRNRVKRIIREVFRQHNVKICNVDLVVVVKQAFPLKDHLQDENLKMLFSLVENRCADLRLS